MPSIIFDDLTGIPTILAANRAARPDQTGVVGGSKAENKEKDKPKKIDFFSKGNESLTPAAVYLDQEDWNVRVFPNKFPVMEHHEIIVHSPHKTKDLEDLSVAHNVKYIRALLNRVGHYTQQEKEVFIFNNRGAKAGASLPHPHSQLVANKGMPGLLEAEKDSALHYFNSHNSCYWCDMIRDEKQLYTRIVFETDYYILLAPKASRWGYETKLYPKKHTPNISLISEEEIQDLGKVLRATLLSYDVVLDGPERNFWVHTQRYEPFHWFFTFMPRIAVLAGLEIGAGIWINGKKAPEDAAAELGARITVEYSS